MEPVLGIHHVTAICSDAQANLDFFTGVMGMRLVKVSVNQDDPGAYHLFYADAEANPGTDLTYFPYPGGRKFQTGQGQVGVTALGIPSGSLAFWSDRFTEHGVAHRRLHPRFGKDRLQFEDPDGMILELLEDDEPGTPWTAVVPDAYAVRRIVGVEMGARDLAATEQALTSTIDHAFEAQEGGVRRYLSSDRRTFVDVKQPEERGSGGHGGVHHVAFGIADRENQRRIHSGLIEAGYHVSPVMDRSWFASIYFREPGGVLFEIATLGPGMTLDESMDKLGTGVMLPSWLEPKRDAIEKLLPPLRLLDGSAIPAGKA